MIGDYDRKAVKFVGGVVGPFRHHSQHAVGKMHIGISRHEEMTDIADIGIDIIHRRLSLQSLISRSAPASQRKDSRRADEFQIHGIIGY